MADLTYRQLRTAVAELEQSVTRSADAIRAKAQWIDEEAQDTSQVAEMIATKSVDRNTVGETHALARIMRGLSDAVIAYASAGDTTAKAAQAVGDQARLTHDGINEQVSRSSVDRIHDVHRDWFEQE
ncbi:hypothetical protein GPZ77_34540 (plasmid) [Streptomyces sp. QHH-9511]|uniref:hypothetical protein n=1 Tax=Streptomyces sp. QHH-9511 TaxID=2684468 RepID=UPI001315E371|nr:hypothetical protein [Streptomyces sp. QHH-9511]QGZ53351.1 hypothetical protein GPZ77_34540 [Streptomyces sp. QHH-9511]